jgi:AcrR family transcriptional regulator
VHREPPGGSPERPDELARLPHGRHGLPSEFVDHNQRERLIASLAHVVAERGYNEATITRVVEGAGVSSRTFYKFFQTVEDCYLAALDAVVTRLGPPLAAAFESEEEWPLQVRAAIAAGLDFFAVEPELARLCTVETFVAGPVIVSRYEEAVAILVPFLRRGRELRADGGAFPDTAERGLLGSMSSLIGRKVAAGETAALPGLLADLTQFALTPYVGASEARRVALSPLP